jgi:3-phenylpropionate/cinnamic acid dioxygenase small subunit
MIKPEDRQEVMDLIANYSFTYDSKDLDGFLNLFAEDAVWDYYVGLGNRTKQAMEVNKEELGEWVTGRFEEQKADGLQARHFMTNTVLTHIDVDHIAAKTMVVIVWRKKSESEPWLEDTGIYVDKFVRTPNGWKFLTRTLTSDDRVRWMR